MFPPTVSQSLIKKKKALESELQRSDLNIRTGVTLDLQFCQTHTKCDLRIAALLCACALSSFELVHG